MNSLARALFLSVLASMAAIGSVVERTAAGQSTSGAVPAISAAEFPPYDSQLLRLVQAGAAAQAAARLIAESAATPETVAALAKQKTWDAAFGKLEKIIAEYPARIAPALDSISSRMAPFSRDDQQRIQERLRAAAGAARKRLADLPRNDAAELAYRLVKIESDSKSRAANIRSFIQEYSGTDAAVNAEVDLIVDDYSMGMPERIRQLDAYIASHPGTCAGARVLYQKGYTLGSNMNVRNADPTDRFMQVFEIIKELESDKYAKCESSGKALSLATGMFAYQPKFAEDNIDRLLNAYRECVISHFTLDDQSPLGNSIGYLINGKMRELYKLKGGGTDDVERELIDLEKKVKEPAATRYLRALFYMDGMDPKLPPAETAALAGKAGALLNEIHNEGAGLYARKALATLAALQYSRSEYPKARESYEKYLAAYPQSPYAWVAALRIGRMHEMTGAGEAALASYQGAAAKYSSVSVAALLGHTHAARVFEANSEFDRAQAEYARALSLWNFEEGMWCALDPPRPRTSLIDWTALDDTVVTKELLENRSAGIAQSLRAPGGRLLESGRYLLEKGKRAEAIAALEQLRKQFPESANSGAALALIHRAILSDALDLAGEENPRADEAAAMKKLEDLAAQPFDPAVGAAKISIACLLWKQGRTDKAEETLSEALARWLEQQPSQNAASDLEKDVVEMRSLAFRPSGDAIYYAFGFNGPRLLSGYWPGYVVVNPEVRVNFADGGMVQVSLRQSFPGRTKVLFADRSQLNFLRNIVNGLGGTKKREWISAMETPNQPIGASMRILALFNKFFPAFPGHWGGWEFLTYPNITQISFINKERTSARVSVTIGYAGADVIMEKVNGKWQAKGLTNQWVT